jgi:hypothetical protein
MTCGILGGYKTFRPSHLRSKQKNITRRRRTEELDVETYGFMLASNYFKNYKC